MANRKQPSSGSKNEFDDTSSMPVSYNAPVELGSQAATDKLADVVEDIMDTVQHTFDDDKSSKTNRSK
ncbi:hypothetical protein ACP26L_09230 [Paenibacillus sp. S-38]|uniref:hypothetical protein n=1 Tax=Paenibacillus sp. S-38 TaxID=3416710 RepID=UPI003CEAB8E3